MLRVSGMVVVAVLVGVMGRAWAGEASRLQLSFESGFYTQSPRYEVRVHVVPPAGLTVTEVTVQVGNERPTPMRLGTPAHAYSAQVELQPGQNMVETRARDSRGRTERMAYPVTYCTGLPSSGELIRTAAAAGRITPQQALVYRAFAMFGDARLPVEFRGDDSQGADTTIMFDLGEQFHTLSPELQKIAKCMLSPFYVPEKRFEFDRASYTGPRSRTPCPDPDSRKPIPYKPRSFKEMTR